MEPTVPSLRPPEPRPEVSAPPIISQKRNLLWLWITLGAVLLIVIGLLAGFFVVKSAADSAARTYTGQVKSYLDDVYDSATSAASNPGDIKKAVEAIDAPVLQPAVLNTVSSDYGAAIILKNDATMQVKALTDTLGRYATVHTFYTQYLKLSDQLTVISDKGVAAAATGSRTLVSTYLSSFLDTLGDIVTLVDESKLPNGLDKDATEVGNVYSEMSTDWGALVAAFNSRSSTAYSTAYDSYQISSDKLGAAVSPITAYYNSLSSKTREAANELRSYRSTIK